MTTVGLIARVRFLSVEPLLEDLGPLDLTGIDRVIVGGESGPKARPMKEAWALALRDRCLAAGVAFWFKQWGAWGPDGVRRDKTANGKRLAGRTWDGRPDGGGSAATAEARRRPFAPDTPMQTAIF